MTPNGQERASALSGDKPDMVEVQLLLGQVHLDRGEFPRAFEMFWAAAQSGQPRALNMLGRAYEQGWGVTRNIQHAVTYFDAAARVGDYWAEFNLGDIHLAGDGVPADATRAYRHYVAAARGGIAKALNMLGLFHEMGIQDAPDPQGARLFFQAGAAGGDCWACLNMGRLCLDENDVPAAVQWFERSLSLGFPDYWCSLEMFLTASKIPALSGLAAKVRRLRTAND